MTGVDDGIEDEIVEIFVEEVDEVLEIINENLKLWEENQVVDRPLKELRRAFHTLKGSGRMVNAQAIGDVGWAVENLLNRIIDGVVKPSPEVLVLIDEVRISIPSLLDAFKNRQAAAVSGVNVQAYIEKVNAIIDGKKDQTLHLIDGIPQLPVIGVGTLEDVEPALVLTAAQLAELAELKHTQAQIKASVADATVEMSSFATKLDELATEVVKFSSLSQNNENEELLMSDKVQQHERLYKEVEGLQYLLKSSMEQMAAEHQSLQQRVSEQLNTLETAMQQKLNSQQDVSQQLQKEMRIGVITAVVVAVTVVVVLQRFVF